MTLSRKQTLDLIIDAGVIAILRMRDADRVEFVAQALAASGVNAIEITMTVPGAVPLLEKLRQRLPPSVILGAGTVLSAATAREVIEAGARFVVSPVFLPELIQVCQSHEAVSIPGCYTPTEIFAAQTAGADLVKVFPAATLGPRYFKNLLAPLPDLRLMPTGGVTQDNAADWIRAGAAALGVGAALVDPALVQRGDAAELSKRAARLVSTVREARAKLATVE